MNHLSRPISFEQATNRRVSIRQAVFAALTISALTVSAMADDRLHAGDTAYANDPTNVLVFATDSIQSLDKLMSYIRDQDKGAMRQLLLEGHLIPLKEGAKIKILSFDPAENAYRVRPFGSTDEVWLIKEFVTTSSQPNE
jgi:hypothetical protein